MKIAFCGALILASSSVWATPASKPWQPLIAAHQSLVSATVGDLNKDGMPDAVLVIEDNKSENRVANLKLGADQLNLNPRHLLVLVKTNNGYQLLARSDSLIPSASRAETPCLSDPLTENGGISIHRGAFTINLHYWYSCGSYWVTTQSWVFRIEKQRVRLIGFDTKNFHRSTGEQIDRSSNFLTHKLKITTGHNMFTDSTAKTVWRDIKNVTPYYLDSLPIDAIRNAP